MSPPSWNFTVQEFLCLSCPSPFSYSFYLVTRSSGFPLVNITANPSASFYSYYQHSSQSSNISSQEDETVCYMVCLSHSQPLTCCSSTWNCSTISFCFSEKVYYHSCYLQDCEWYLYNTFHSFPHAICLWLCSFLSCKDHHFFIFHPSIFGYIFSLN